MPASARGLEARLEFDGVYMNSDVWINGVHLGKRPYGYISFAYDISHHVVPGVNVVAVRVDNSSQPNSRWYSGSGIDRHVWLTLSDSLHVAHWGTYVTTPRADSTRADVVVRTQKSPALTRRSHWPRASDWSWSSNFMSQHRDCGRSRSRTSMHFGRKCSTAPNRSTS